MYAYRIFGVQAFREYYPPPCKEFIYLECVWEEGKFVLHETAMTKKKDCNTEVIPMMEVGMEVPTILYETIEVSEEGEIQYTLKFHIPISCLK